jgi:hypothetical protein
LRAAVQDLSQGKSAEGFDKPDKFGAIREIEDNAERLSAIVRTHLAAIDLKRTSLVVAPTHAECRAIAEAVRAELKKTGLLAGRSALLSDCRTLASPKASVAARFVPHSQPSQRLILYFPVATIWVTGGPKVLEFYEALAKQRATLLKADGKDILSIKVHLNSEREAE